MPQTKEAIERFVFLHGSTADQYEGRLIQSKMSNDLLLKPDSVNRGIVKSTREDKKCTASLSRHPGPSDLALRHWRNCEVYHRCKASDTERTVDVCLRTAVCYLH